MPTAPNQKSLFKDPPPPQETGKKKRVNTALERRVSAYPPMSFVKMLTALAHESILSKSAVETKILREFFTALPLERQRELIAIYDRLTPAQRNRPGSIRENEE